MYIPKFEVEMDANMLEKVNAGFPHLKFTKIEETSGGAKTEVPKETTTSSVSESEAEEAEESEEE